MKHINPEGLIKNPAFSQIVITSGKGNTIYIGGQNAVNREREIVGIGNIALQTDQVMKNLETALHACDATFNDLVKLTIHIVQGENALAAFQVAQNFLTKATHPPVITVLFVAGLINPNFLLEVDAIAFVKEAIK